MKTRIISALIIALIIIPIVIYGGLAFDIMVSLLALFAFSEFLNIKEKKNKLPFFIKIICYLIFLLIIIGFNNLDNNIFTVDFRILSVLFIFFLIPTVIYHDNRVYNISDAFYLIGSILFLGISFSSIIYLRHLDFNIIFYIILIAVTSDTYAYFGGYLIGKHKLIPTVSPNKTWEGTIIGTTMCVALCTIYYVNFVDSDTSLLVAGLISLNLSIVGQFGDLVFSSIKRYYDKKDYSNLIPGHGGILDRLDSIIFIVLGYMFLMTII